MIKNKSSPYFQGVYRVIFKAPTRLTVSNPLKYGNCGLRCGAVEAHHRPSSRKEGRKQCRKGRVEEAKGKWLLIATGYS